MTGMGGLVIRAAEIRDWPAVARLVAAAFRAAFGGTGEVDLIERLRRAGLIDIELVAEQDGTIVGHIVFSRLGIEAGGHALKALALAPSLSSRASRTGERAAA